MISTQSVVTRAKHQVSCDLGGEAAILNLSNGVYYGLNEVGARVWDLLAEQNTVARIRDLLVEEFDVDAERCAGDLLALLERMHAEGLLEVAEAPGEEKSVHPL